MLTKQKKKFCLAVAQGKSYKEAAIMAGYTKRSARQAGSRLMTNDDIIAEVERLMEKVNKKAVEAAIDKTNLTTQRVIDGLLRIYEFDIRKIINPDGTIKKLQDFPDDIALALAGIEIEVTEDKKGKTTTKYKIKQPDRKGAGELLGKTLAMFVDKVIEKDKLTEEQNKTLELLKNKSKVINFPGQEKGEVK